MSLDAEHLSLSLWGRWLLWKPEEPPLTPSPWISSQFAPRSHLSRHWEPGQQAAPPRLGSEAGAQGGVGGPVCILTASSARWFYFQRNPSQEGRSLGGGARQELFGGHQCCTWVWGEVPAQPRASGVDPGQSPEAGGRSSAQRLAAHLEGLHLPRWNSSPPPVCSRTPANEWTKSSPSSSPGRVAHSGLSTSRLIWIRGQEGHWAPCSEFHPSHSSKQSLNNGGGAREGLCA